MRTISFKYPGPPPISSVLAHHSRDTSSDTYIIPHDSHDNPEGWAFLCRQANWGQSPLAKSHRADKGQSQDSNQTGQLNRLCSSPSQLLTSPAPAAELNHTSSFCTSPAFRFWPTSSGRSTYRFSQVNPICSDRWELLPWSTVALQQGQTLDSPGTLLKQFSSPTPPPSFWVSSSGVVLRSLYF